MEAIEPRFLVVQLKSPLRKFYALHHDFVNRYGISCVTKDKKDHDDKSTTYDVGGAVLVQTKLCRG